MRTKLPIVAAILGLFLLLLGLGGRFLMTGETAQQASVSMPAGASDATLLRIPAETGGSDGLDVDLSGAGPWDIALVRSVDAGAWIGDAKEIAVTRDGGALKAELRGSSPTAPERASDNSFAKVTEQKSGGTLHIAPVSDDQKYDVVVLAKKGTDLPSSVNYTKKETKGQPWGVPLMIAGGLILLGSLLWWFLTRRGENHDRPLTSGSHRVVPASGAHEPTEALGTAETPARNLPDAAPSADTAPPAGRTDLTDGLTGESRKALSALTAAALVGALALPGGLPQASSSTSTESQPASSALAGDKTPTVSGEQLQRIVNEVSAAASAADSTRNPEALAPRFEGPARTMRSYNYAVRAKNKSTPAPAAIPTKIVTSMTPYSDSYPRSVVAVVQESDASLPIALVLRQADAHSPYVLRETMSMLPGAEFPKPATDQGKRSAGQDEKGTAAMSAKDTMAALSDFLSNPTGPNKDTFQTTSFQTELLDFEKKARASNPGAKTQFSHEVDWHDVYAMPTEDGGRMVFGYMRLNYFAAAKSAAQPLDISGTPYQAIVGSQTVKSSLTVGYGESVMVYVPKDGDSKKPIVTGVDQELLYARTK